MNYEPHLYSSPVEVLEKTLCEECGENNMAEYACRNHLKDNEAKCCECCWCCTDDDELRIVASIVYNKGQAMVDKMEDLREYLRFKGHYEKGEEV